MNKYNVYNKNWKLLGWFWRNFPFQTMKETGDYIFMVYSGPILTIDNEEFESIKPILVYIKLMDIEL